MLVTASTRTLGLIGRDIQYSLSPKIHNSLFQKNNLDFVYLKFDLEEALLKNFLEIAWSIESVGFNVTQPYKLTISKLLKTPYHGSVNTLYRGENGWEATSTDSTGFLEGLKRIRKEIFQFNRIGWIGFGGAAVSIAEGISQIPEQKDLHSDVFVRNPQKTSAHEFLLKKISAKTHELTKENLQKFVEASDPQTLLIQASSAPLSGDDLSRFGGILEGFRGSFVDLVYGKPSALYFEAIRRNISCLDGEPMLIEQARAAQKLWFGQSLSYEEIQRVLR